VEEPRECYEFPICYKCLPPPNPAYPAHTAQYRHKPTTVEAKYFKTGGTAEVFGTKIEIPPDSYVYKGIDGVMVVKRERFMAEWEQVSG
jgi:hypothetical protein